MSTLQIAQVAVVGRRGSIRERHIDRHGHAIAEPRCTPCLRIDEPFES